AEQLADAITAVGPRGDVGPDTMMARIETHRVVRRCKYHPFDALPARSLEQVVTADDVGLQDDVPRPFNRKPAEMQNAVDAVADRFNLREIGEVGLPEGLISPEICRRLDVA